MKANKVIYALTIEDIQKVAEETLGRELRDKEIKSILDSIAENIPWYDAIENAINNQNLLEKRQRRTKIS